VKIRLASFGSAICVAAVRPYVCVTLSLVVTSQWTDPSVSVWRSMRANSPSDRGRYCWTTRSGRDRTSSDPSAFRFGTRSSAPDRMYSSDSSLS
jgi:hypothetical protein